jgi:phosphonate utilization transcriptional regulator
MNDRVPTRRAPGRPAARSLGMRRAGPADGDGAAAHGAVVLQHPTIALLRTASLASVAQQEIERLILAGELAPGAKLTEVALSARLGVSRGPIREAFRRLEEAGLVRQEKNRGVFVRDIPPDEAAEIFDLRAVMDELAGRRLAERITAEQAGTLRSIVDRMEAAARRNKPDAYHLLNLEFHDRLVEFTGNRKMAEMYRRLVKELALARWRNLAQRQALPHSVAEHRQILKAITDGDVETAGQLLFRHAIESKQRMLRLEPAPVRRSVRRGA